MKIEWDKEANIIHVGPVKFESYMNFKNATVFAFYICEEAGISTKHLKTAYAFAEDVVEKRKPKNNIRERNAALGNILGCSTAVLFKHFMKLQNKAFVAPVYDIYKAVKEYKPWKKGCWDANILKKVNERKSLLQPVYQDGLTNLLPVVFHLKKSPQELKKEFGNSWKLVANNSLTRNKYLGDVLRGTRDAWRKEMIRAEIPSTLLKKPFSYRPEQLLWLKNNYKGKWGRREEMMHAARLYNDTQRMAEQVGVKFNPNWTARRMKEMHDKFSADITARKYSKVVFDSVKDIEVETVEHEGYVATLLKSAFEIADEGAAMGHCVAGYADNVRLGDYLVYSITKDGERSSTLGICKQLSKQADTKDVWRFSQHYGKYNQRLTNTNEIVLGTMIVGILNKEKECTH